MAEGLDSRDREIITMLSRDPDIPQEAIAAALRLSQPSVAVRIKKLRESGALRLQAGVVPLEFGLTMAKVDIASNDTQGILNQFQVCPYFANGFTVSGKHNLCLFFISESISSLESIINGHLRTHPSVTELDFNIIISSQKPHVVPVDLVPERVKKAPCGCKLECRHCQMFKEKKCNGCPATGQYQGKFY